MFIYQKNEFYFIPWKLDIEQNLFWTKQTAYYRTYIIIYYDANSTFWSGEVGELVSHLLFYITWMVELSHSFMRWVRRGHDRMVVGFTTTCAMSAYRHWSCEFAPLSWWDVLDATLCDKFVSDLRQVGGFLQALQFPRPINMTSTVYKWNIVESGIQHQKPKPNYQTIYEVILISFSLQSCF
jgi:hypothetical protein